MFPNCLSGEGGTQALGWGLLYQQEGEEATRSGGGSSRVDPRVDSYRRAPRPREESQYTLSSPAEHMVTERPSTFSRKAVTWARC